MGEQMARITDFCGPDGGLTLRPKAINPGNALAADERG